MIARPDPSFGHVAWLFVMLIEYVWIDGNDRDRLLRTSDLNFTVIFLRCKVTPVPERREGYCIVIQARYAAVDIFFAAFHGDIDGTEIELL